MNRAMDQKTGASGLPESAMPLPRVWRGLLVFYALALALNAGSLHRNNEQLPYGPVRSFWVGGSAPVARAAATLGLDRPRDLLAGTLGAVLNK